jgi:uncharacterized protein YneF (UPF0154 family)
LLRTSTSHGKPPAQSMTLKQFQSKGGKSRSEKKIKAVRENLAKARAIKLENAKKDEK